MNELLKYKSKYDNLDYKCNLSGKEALREVKQNGYFLQYVKEQTPEICLAAVQQDGHALKYVEKQTLNICLAALEETDDAINFVKLRLF